MRQFIWLVAGLTSIWSVASVLGATETPGWRPKNSAVAEPTVVQDPTTENTAFDWRDDLYGAPFGGELAQKEEESRKRTDWCSCPTCENCGKFKPVRASYPVAPKKADLIQDAGRMANQSTSVVQKRLRLAIMPKTMRR